MKIHEKDEFVLRQFERKAGWERIFCPWDRRSESRQNLVSGEKHNTGQIWIPPVTIPWCTLRIRKIHLLTPIRYNIYRTIPHCSYKQNREVVEIWMIKEGRTKSGTGCSHNARSRWVQTPGGQIRYKEIHCASQEVSHGGSSSAARCGCSLSLWSCYGSNIRITFKYRLGTAFL